MHFFGLNIHTFGTINLQNLYIERTQNFWTIFLLQNHLSVHIKCSCADTILTRCQFTHRTHDFFCFLNFCPVFSACASCSFHILLKPLKSIVEKYTHGTSTKKKDSNSPNFLDIFVWAKAPFALILD
jgi:hypothetical protein